MYFMNFMIIGGVVFLLLSISTLTFYSVDASMENNYTKEFVNYTSSKNLKVTVEWKNTNFTNDEKTIEYFRIQFINPENNKLQNHIDYDFAISEKGKEIFRLSNQSGQPLFPMHSSNGIGVIPIYEFDKGKYLIKVEVEGISFIPIDKEQVDFEFKVP
ncbi:MAG: hypothetical protein R2685_02555 [Candidatus Nitrosocosmicus sp.]|nr:hypothetical protein [Candidatus Nitrosocosmicus sp.]